MAKRLRKKVIKISIKKIKRINASKLGDAALKMVMSISGSKQVFKGVQPFTPDEIKTLITAYSEAKVYYKLNGLMGKMAYINAFNALIDAMVAFAPYVNRIAKGDKRILAASTLPTTEVAKDVAKMFKEGHTASDVEGKQVKNGQLLTDCTPFGDGVDYIMVLSEDEPLPIDFCINSSGQIMQNGGIMNRIFIDIAASRKKKVDGVVVGKLYYIYYLMVFGGLVSRMSKAVQVVIGF